MKQAIFTLEQLANLTNSQLVGNPKFSIRNVADLDSATEEDASFLANPRYENAMRKSKAGVVIIAPTIPLMSERNFLVNENPSKAFQTILELFHNSEIAFSGFQGIHATAVIHETAKIGKHVAIGPHAVIDAHVTIGNNTFIGSGCYVGPYSTIGENCTLHPHVVVREKCAIANRVIIQPGAIIGSCGFGYITDNQGRHTKLTQCGTVIVEDDVEIGANATIDRARFKATRIGRGSKLDNLVQIAHGVILGQDNILAAQTGVAGSTTTGRCVIAGGQVAIAGHLKIADGVMLAGKSGVTKSLLQKGEYSGFPAIPRSEHNKNSVLLRNISSYIDKIDKLHRVMKHHLDTNIA